MEHVARARSARARRCSAWRVPAAWSSSPTRPGASPWGGHETSPWHYLGGEYAARRYDRVARPPAQEPLRHAPCSPTHVGDGLAWARASPTPARRGRARATTPTGPASSSTCPVLREVADLEPLLMVLQAPMTDAVRGVRPRLAAALLLVWAVAWSVPGRADLRGHQERPLRRPVGLPVAGRAPVGPPGHLGRPPEPGLRLPLPDGPVLRRRRRRSCPSGWPSGCGGACCSPSGCSPTYALLARPGGRRPHRPGASGRSPTR